MKSKLRQRNGMALVIGLICVVIATILVVGFTVSMRLERQASGAMANNGRADIIAQNAIEHAIALLDTNIPQPVPPGAAPTPQNWIVNPGLLTKFSGRDGTSPAQIPLSTNTGADPTAAPTNDFVNLNASPSGSTDYPIIPTGEPVNASWIYVAQDPTQPASVTNPIVGRYAFWMDDESAKINLNMAYGKPLGFDKPPVAKKMDLSKVNPLQQVADLNLYGTADTDPDTDPHAAAPDDPSSSATPNYHTTGDNSDPLVENNPPPKITSEEMANAVGLSPRPRYFPLWHPSAINLDLLGSNLNRNSLVDWIYNGSPVPSFVNPGQPNYRLLTYPDQVKQFVITNPDEFYNQNKFFLTTSSRSPEFNVFGKSRIFLERRFPDVKKGSNPPVPNDYDRPQPNQPIIFQNDYDVSGPTYFHGYENLDLRSATGIQHVADSISDLLNRNDWPGMPQTSFVEKWGGGITGELEADQVAANIAIMGSYAAGGYDRIVGSGRDVGWMEGIEPVSNWLLGYIDPNNAAGANWPANKIRKGKLSQKAIVPYIPRPMLSEIAFTIAAEPPDSPTPTYGSTQAYRLKVTAQVEFYLPEKVPLVNIKGQYAQKFVLTHLDYTAEGTGQDGQPVSATQTANNYTIGNGVARLNASLQPQTGLTLVVRPGSYKTIASDLPAPSGANHREFYIRNDLAAAATNGTNLSHSTTAGKGISAPIFFQQTVTISGHLRAVTYTQNNYGIQQLIPVWDNQDGSAAMASVGTAADRISFNFEINLAALGQYIQNGQSITRSIQIADARLGGLANQWTMTPANASDLNGDSLGDPNPASTDPAVASILNTDEKAYFDSQNFFYSESPRGSIGMLASIPTGMQRGLIGETLKFQPSGDPSKIPDWVLLDLLGPSIWPNTYMNSTLGKVNVNANIYPNLGIGIERWIPLQAVFQNMRTDTTVDSGTSSMNVSDASAVVRNILNHTLASDGHDFGAYKRYDYIGELCEIAGVADSGTTNWEKEALIRNLANLLTTKSNTFSVWGVAQVIRKKPGNTDYGLFESGDQVLGEKRFQAIVDRYVWPGRDGVPGNGHVTNGTYDSLASPLVYTTRVPWDAPALPGGAGAVWAVIDGPDAPTYAPSSASWAAVQNITSPTASLETANNPLRAHMKYRVTSFRYLNEY